MQNKYSVSNVCLVTVFLTEKARFEHKMLKYAHCSISTAILIDNYPQILMQSDDIVNLKFQH